MRRRAIFDILKMIAGSLFPNSDLSKEKEPEFDLFKFCSTLYRFVQDKKIPREIFALRLGGFAVFAFKSGWRNLWFGPLHSS